MRRLWNGGVADRFLSIYVGVWLLLLILVIRHLVIHHIPIMLSEDHLPSLLIQSVELLLLVGPVIGLAYIGYRIHDSRFNESESKQILAYHIFGMVSVYSVVGAITVHHALLGYGFHWTLAEMEILSGLGFGGLLGAIGGIHRVQATFRKRTIDERSAQLHAEKERAENLQQRLSVVNRIIRHDIRSAVNIITGNVERVREEEGDVTQSLQIIQSQAERLHEISENTRIIEETLRSRSAGTAEQDIGAIVEDTIAECRDKYDDVSIRTEIPDGIRAEAHERIGAAIEEALQNAVVHNDSARPEIRVTVTEGIDDEEWAEIAIADNGPGIPEAELDPLEEGIESALDHSSGLGLWLIRWVVDRSDGKLRFSENEPRGTIVRIRLPQ